MDYEDIEDDKLPQGVKDMMMTLIQLSPEALIEEVLSWSSFYRGWTQICRRRGQSNRLDYINSGTLNTLARECSDDAAASTLMSTLWCMPDDFLDDVLKIYISINMTQQE